MKTILEQIICFGTKLNGSECENIPKEVEIVEKRYEAAYIHMHTLM